MHVKLVHLLSAERTPITAPLHGPEWGGGPAGLAVAPVAVHSTALGSSAA